MGAGIHTKTDIRRCTTYGEPIPLDVLPLDPEMLLAFGENKGKETKEARLRRAGLRQGERVYIFLIPIGMFVNTIKLQFYLPAQKYLGTCLTDLSPLPALAQI